MENIGDEYKNYWETHMFYQTEELDSWGRLDETFSGYYDSSSPDGTQSPAAKNIMSERNRRKKLNDKLFALRAVVPNISKMDKASIIKDAIEYIKELQDQIRIIQGEIMDLECRRSECDVDQETGSMSTGTSNTKRIQQSFHSKFSPIHLLEVRVSYVGEKTMLVSLKCKKRRETMVKLCQLIESLNLNILTANLTAFTATIFYSLFIQGEEEETDFLKMQIQTAMSALNDPGSPMST